MAKFFGVEIDVDYTGILLSGFTAMSSAVGNYYSTQANQLKLQSDAEQLRLQQKLGNINASLIEDHIEYSLRAAEQKRTLASLRAGKEIEDARAKFASSGLDLSVGTASERVASLDFKKQYELLTMDANAVSQIEAERMKKANVESEALLAGSKSSGLMTISNALSPVSDAIGAGSKQLASYGMNKYLFSNLTTKKNK